MIELVSRLFGLSAYEAAQKLAYDFGIDPDKPPTAAALKKPKYQLVKAFRENEIYCQRVLCDYLHLLEDWKVRYAPSDPKEELDDRFVEACQMLDYIEHLADILTVAEFEQRATAVDLLMKDGSIVELEKRLSRLKEEAKSHGKEQELF